MRRPATFLLAAAVLALGACASEEPGVDLTAVSYAAADALIEDAGDRVARDSPIVYAAFRPAGRLETPTRLGRILADGAASRFVQRGYSVVEVRLRKQVAVRPGGPFLLSDDARAVGQRVLAKAALVGSYAATVDRLLLNIRLIDVATGIVLASHDAAIPAAFEERTLINERALIYEDGW